MWDWGGEYFGVFVLKNLIATIPQKGRSAWKRMKAPFLNIEMGVLESELWDDFIVKVVKGIKCL